MSSHIQILKTLQPVTSSVTAVANDLPTNDFGVGLNSTVPTSNLIKGCVFSVSGAVVFKMLNGDLLTLNVTANQIINIAPVGIKATGTAIAIKAADVIKILY